MNQKQILTYFCNNDFALPLAVLKERPLRPFTDVRRLLFPDHLRSFGRPIFACQPRPNYFIWRWFFSLKRAELLAMDHQECSTALQKSSWSASLIIDLNLYSFFIFHNFFTCYRFVSSPFFEYVFALTTRFFIIFM